jgi:hypothetical protein
MVSVRNIYRTNMAMAFSTSPAHIDGDFQAADNVTLKIFAQPGLGGTGTGATILAHLAGLTAGWLSQPLDPVGRRFAPRTQRPHDAARLG